jgi:hypothetical protein
MGPGDRAAAKSTAPMVSAMPAAAAPVMDMTSPALALSSSSLPTPLRLKILVTLLSAPGAPTRITMGQSRHMASNQITLITTIYMVYTTHHLS